MNVRERLSRNVSMDRPFGVSFDGGRKRAHRPPVRALTFTKRRPPEQQMHAAEAEQQRIAAMTPEQYARHVGLSEDQVARVRRIAELRGWQQAKVTPRRLKSSMAGEPGSYGSRSPGASSPL